jgi:hypothetical protein
MFDESWIRRDLEISSTRDILLPFSWRDGVKPRIFFVGIYDVPAEIRTYHLPNSNLEQPAWYQRLLSSSYSSLSYASAVYLICWKLCFTLITLIDCFSFVPLCWFCLSFLCICAGSTGPGFDSRRFQIFWEAAGLERGPLSLVRTSEKLLEGKSSGPGLEN